MYYVGFSSATIVASLILFQGFNTTDGTNTVSLLMGFIVTFLGVHLLNISRIPPPPIDANGHSALEGGLLNPRLSLQGRMSLDGWNGVASERTDLVGAGARSHHHRRNSSSVFRSPHTGGAGGRAETLFNAFDATEGPESVGLRELREELGALEEESDDDADEHTHLHKTINRNGHAIRPVGPDSATKKSTKPKSSPIPASGSGSRSQSHSPAPLDQSLGDGRQHSR